MHCTLEKNRLMRKSGRIYFEIKHEIAAKKDLCNYSKGSRNHGILFRHHISCKTLKSNIVHEVLQKIKMRKC